MVDPPAAAGLRLAVLDGRDLVVCSLWEEVLVVVFDFFHVLVPW